MQKPALRIGLVALLLAAGAVAALITWNGEQRMQAIDRDRVARDAVLGRLLPALTGVADAQQVYADYGRRDAATFERVSTLIGRMAADAAALRASQSADDARHLEEFWAALSALRAADAQAQQSLRAGEPLTAADVILTGARPHVTAADAALDAYRTAITQRDTATRASLVRRSWLALGAAGGAWAVGLLALARGPRPRPEIANLPPPETVPALSLRMDIEPAAAPPVAAAPAPARSIDLAATADICAALARLTDSASLPPLLGRAATILDARGLVLWMSAGDDLYPAAAHGYDATVLARLRPIRRSDENATALAWRECRLRTVTAVHGGPGAIVAPIAGADGCVGVLAAEVGAGREEDGATQAVAAIFGAQLATVLAAWPAASGVSAPPGPGDGPASDRQAAAS